MARAASLEGGGHAPQRVQTSARVNFGPVDGGFAISSIDLITEAAGDVSRLEDQANAAVSGLMTGSGVDVHQAMIATEKADMAFELALAVRNKAVQAYQSVMGMQF